MSRARAEMLLCRVMLLATLAACALSGGCEMARHETMALGNGPLVADGGRAASSSEAVFEVPEANALAVAYGRENLPESYRLDGRMNIYSPVAPAGDEPVAAGPGPRCHARPLRLSPGHHQRVVDDHPGLPLHAAAMTQSRQVPAFICLA